MEAQFEFETERSIWSFNFDAMMCWRRPRLGEDSGAHRDHEGISYAEVGKPRPFKQLFPFPGNGYFIGFEDLTDKVSGKVLVRRGEIPEDFANTMNG